MERLADNKKCAVLPSSDSEKSGLEQITKGASSNLPAIHDDDSSPSSLKAPPEEQRIPIKKVNEILLRAYDLQLKEEVRKAKARVAGNLIPTSTSSVADQDTIPMSRIYDLAKTLDGGISAELVDKACQEICPTDRDKIKAVVALTGAIPRNINWNLEWKIKEYSVDIVSSAIQEKAAEYGRLAKLVDSQHPYDSHYYYGVWLGSAPRRKQESLLYRIFHPGKTRYVRDWKIVGELGIISPEVDVSAEEDCIQVSFTRPNLDLKFQSHDFLTNYAGCIEDTYNALSTRLKERLSTRYPSISFQVSTRKAGKLDKNADYDLLGGDDCFGSIELLADSSIEFKSEDYY
ncbi:hypothetical protein JW711_02140 [Candidatus Woesearchaeota archaeon]|nr:hypothetical protein [Candidatus Woesearchaeota archaeon]